MAIKFVQSIDMNQNQILNLQLQNLVSDPGTPVKGQLWINTTSNLLKYYDGTTVQILCQLSNTVNDLESPSSSFSMNNNKITNLGTPTGNSDAATKQYVDTGSPAILSGTVGAIPYQSAPSTTSFLAGNTTSTDQVLVSHGTGSTAQAPTFSNAPALNAASMSNFPLLNQNTTGTAAGLSTTLSIASGGTNAITATAARNNLGATGKYAVTFGDGSSTSYVITHNLGSNDVIVGVYYVGGLNQVVECEVQLTSANTITLVFAVVPALNSLRAVVIG